MEIEKAQDRLDVLKKIEELERAGIFDKDVEDDPPTFELFPDQIDYKRKKLKNKILRYVVYKKMAKVVYKMMDDGLFQIDDIIGLENLKSVKTGAILTCNHFSPADSFAMQLAFWKAKIKHKRMYRIIREGNFTNPPPGFEMVMRHCDTLPLSQNHNTMKKFLKCTNELIREGNFVLVYPEDSLWWNYRKPKPLKPGAFTFALRNNVPVIPFFITMRDSDVIASDGFPVQAMTIHISKPIYADKNLSFLENREQMMNKNFEVWKDIYESVYQTKLEYDTIVTDSTDPLVKKYAKK